MSITHTLLPISHAPTKCLPRVYMQYTYIIIIVRVYIYTTCVYIYIYINKYQFIIRQRTFTGNKYISVFIKGICFFIIGQLNYNKLAFDHV